MLDVVVRVKPNSSVKGLKNMPKEERAPAIIRVIKILMNTMIQP